MFVEHLFLFFPVFLFASGIGLFAWLFHKLSSEPKKSGKPKYKNSSLKSVLHSAAQSPDNISIKKFKAFASHSHKPLASEVYPEPVNVKEIADEIKSIFTKYAGQQEKHLSVMSSIENKYRELSETSRPEDNEKVRLLVEEKNKCFDVINSIYADMEEQLADKQRLLEEYVERYNRMQMHAQSVTGSSRMCEFQMEKNLREIIASVHQVRREARGRRNSLHEQTARLENKRRLFYSQRDELLKKQHEESLRTSEYIKSEIENLHNETAKIQKDAPSLIAEKEEQINQMRSAIELFETRMTQEQHTAESSLEQFKKHMEYKITRAASILDKARSGWNREFQLRSEERTQLQNALEERERKLQADIAEKQKLHETDVLELKKQQEGLNRQFEKQRQAYEKQELSYAEAIAGLQNQIAQKEADFNARTVSLEQRKQIEKTRLLNVLNNLRETLKTEQERHTNKQAAHAAAIERLQGESREHIQELTGSGELRTDMLQQENLNLREHVAGEQKRMEFNIQTWKDQEIKYREEKTAIERRIQQLEKNMNIQQERQYGTYVLETTELNQQVKEMESHLKKTNNEYRELIEKQNWELECLQVKEKRKAEQAKELWLDRETQFAAEKQELENEQRGLIQQMQKSAESAERKRQELIGAIKALRKDVPRKQEFADSLMHKRDREYKKLIQPLQEKISKIRSSMAADMKMYKDKLTDRDDQIKTLQLRLAWRDERQQASESRRQKEIDKTREQLNKEIDILRMKSHKTSIKQDRSFEPIVRDFEKLNQDLGHTEYRLEAEKTANEEVRKGRFAIESEINRIEQRLPQDMAQHITLLDLKAKEIRELNREVLQKEHLMDTEEIISRDAMQRLRASFKTLKLQASKVIASKEDQPTEKK